MDVTVASMQVQAITTPQNVSEYTERRYRENTRFGNFNYRNNPKVRTQKTPLKPDFGKYSLIV